MSIINSSTIMFVIFLAMAIITVFNIRKVFKVYQDHKQIAYLYFLLAFICVLGGSTTIGIYSFMTSYTLTIPSHVTTFNELLILRIIFIIGMIISTSALIFINFFSLENTFPERKKPFMIVIAISGSLFIIILTIANVNGVLGGTLANISGSYTIYDPIIVMLGVISIAPSTVSSPALFLYYGAKVRAKDEGRANRGLIFGISFLLTNIGFVMGNILTGTELTYAIIITVGISLILLSAILVFFCLYMPKWFKKLIKWQSD